MHINDIVEELKHQDYSSFDLEKLFQLLLKFDFKSLDLGDTIPEIVGEHDYTRNILCLDPMEVVVLSWPPHSASAIHLHDGFWGVVSVVQGELENVTFKHHENVMTMAATEVGHPGGMLKEPDGVIHLLRNPADELAVTVHFYCPALESFEGMEIFDLKAGRIGVLSESASSASWSEPPSSFKEVKENAFEYHASQKGSGPSHRVHPIIPKPSGEAVEALIKEYYAEQAHKYDHFDTTHASRRAYIKKVNELIANEIAKLNPRDFLAIACGTGRRPLEIQQLSGMDYELYGVDISPEMAEIASSRGLSTVCNRWLDVEMNGKTFDTITFLYAFGHISSEEERRQTVKKIADCLEPGGHFFVDVFNLHDQNEWGPKSLKVIEDRSLEDMGYERGDVFYQKSGGATTAYLHYFEESEITRLLEDAGLTIKSILHIGYTKNPGQILNDPNQGSLFVVAEKTH